MDQLTLSALSGETLKLGVEFLYGQAAEVLRRWRERRDGENDGKEVLAPWETGRVLQNSATLFTIDYDSLEKLRPQISALRGRLTDYVEGVELIDSEDRKLLAIVAALRSELEVVLGQRLTLRGETRTDIDVTLDVGEIQGYVAGLISDGVPDGTVRVDMSAAVVGRGARMIGVNSRAPKRKG